MRFQQNLRFAANMRCKTAVAADSAKYAILLAKMIKTFSSKFNESNPAGFCLALLKSGSGIDGTEEEPDKGDCLEQESTDVNGPWSKLPFASGEDSLLPANCTVLCITG